MSIITSVLNKITSIRNANIERRESINRVKQALKQHETHAAPAELDDDAKRLSKELKVSYTDALNYVTSERNHQSRGASIRKFGNSLAEIGVNARADTAARAKREGWGDMITMNKPDLTQMNCLKPKVERI